MPYIINSPLLASYERKNHIARVRGKALYGINGCLLRSVPYGFIDRVNISSAFFPRIPRTEWKYLIESQHGTFLSDIRKGKLPPHDQGHTNYCWAHGSVRAVEILRIYEGQAPKLLSAESVAVPITGGRNRGGSPDDALQFLRSFGACDQELWPKNDLNINHATKGWEDEALNHVVIAWADVENWDDQITLALHRVPVAIGLRWWGHLVCQLDPVILPNGDIGISIDNSWGPDWGENGEGQLNEKYGTADLGAFAPLSETFSPT